MGCAIQVFFRTGWRRNPTSCGGAGDQIRFVFSAPGNRTAVVGELVMLPVRVGVRVTRLWFRAFEETVSVTERVVGLVISRGANGAASDPRPPAQRRREPPSSPAEDSPSATAARDLRSVAPATQSVDESDQASEEPELVEEPVHVSEEPVLVEELAEPGAEQGAGPEVHVDPPWDGYERMNAKQVIDRLAAADPAALAAVQLYEGTNRRRQTVMNAVRRELRLANASGPRTKPTNLNHQKG